MSRSKRLEKSIEINQKQFKELISKLDLLMKLTAANIFRGDENLKKGILFLSNLKLTTKEIADILGATDRYVRKVKSEGKKDKKQETTEASDRKENVE